MADMRAHTPQSLELPSGCFTCAARAVASGFSAPGHTVLCPLGAMRTILTAMLQVCGPWGELQATVGWPSGSTINSMLGAKRWWAVHCRIRGVSNQLRYTTSEPPSSTYRAMSRAAGVWKCCWSSQPSLGSIMAWGARHCATSATSATVSSPSSVVGSAATRK